MEGMLITEILTAAMRGGTHDKSLTCLSVTNSINKIDKIKEINPKTTRISVASLTGTAAAAKAWPLILHEKPNISPIYHTQQFLQGSLLVVVIMRSHESYHGRWARYQTSSVS